MKKRNKNRAMTGLAIIYIAVLIFYYLVYVGLVPVGLSREHWLFSFWVPIGLLYGSGMLWFLDSWVLGRR